jgi:hypothetical protein
MYWKKACCLVFWPVRTMLVGTSKSWTTQFASPAAPLPVMDMDPDAPMVRESHRMIRPRLRLVVVRAALTVKFPYRTT